MSAPLAKYVTVKELLQKLADVPQNTEFVPRLYVTKSQVEFTCNIPSSYPETEGSVSQSVTNLSWDANVWNNFDISTNANVGRDYSKQVDTVEDLVKLLSSHVDFSGSVTYGSRMLSANAPVKMTVAFATNDVAWKSSMLAEPQWKKLRAIKAILELFNLNHADTNQESVDNSYLTVIQSMITRMGITDPFYLLRTVAGNWQLFSTKSGANQALRNRYRTWPVTAHLHGRVLIPVGDLVAERFAPLDVAPGIRMLSEAAARKVVDATYALGNLPLDAQRDCVIDKLAQ